MSFQKKIHLVQDDHWEVRAILESIFDILPLFGAGSITALPSTRGTKLPPTKTKTIATITSMTPTFHLNLLYYRVNCGPSARFAFYVRKWIGLWMLLLSMYKHEISTLVPF